jgi:hypothetical protein
MKELQLLFELFLFPFLFIGTYLGRLFTIRTEDMGYRYHLSLQERWNEEIFQEKG